MTFFYIWYLLKIFINPFQDQSLSTLFLKKNQIHFINRKIRNFTRKTAAEQKQ